MKFARKSAPIALAVAGLVALSGCGTAAGEDGTAGGTVTITVGGKPTAERPEALAEFERQLTEFTALHPEVTVETDDSVWDAQTFQALVAGGQLPTVYYVPFTEMRGLIERGQVADVSEAFAGFESLSGMNPSVLDVVTGDNGEIFGVPTAAYSMGLLYNRDLFTQAGLDPDSPPQNWDEVRAAAQAIEAKTDAQGFASMTIENTGGWILTTMSNGFGDTVESADGTKSTINNDATRDVLDFYSDLRWTDNSFGSNFLLNYGDAMKAFSAGSIGMFVQGADAYSTVVINNEMDPNAFGLGPLPQGPDGIGTLGGGSVAIVNPTATPEQIEAALQWVEFVKIRKLTDEKTAVAEAKAAAAEGVAVGAPGLPLLGSEANERYLGWIKDYINVPRENFTAYFATADTLPLIPEPSHKAQEVYGMLDSVVQAVLTRQDADIDALLNDAQKSAQALIDAG